MFAQTTKLLSEAWHGVQHRSRARERSADRFTGSDLGASANALFRKASCACGGGCPTCQWGAGQLKVSQPHDAAEMEADAIADRVMRMPAGAEAPNPTNHIDSRDGLHRKCGSCAEEDETIKRKPLPAAGGSSLHNPAHVNNVINSGGQPLDRPTRQFFEPRLGRDLSAVRVHSDAAASQSARAVDARAYTLGNNIVFGSGEYAPHSERGRHLLAHELAHVTQGDNHGTLRRSIIIEDPGGQPPPPFRLMTNAQMVQGWLSQLCGEGAWTVDAATGVVSTAVRSTYCAATAPAASTLHFSTGSAPTSCGCLCELTAPGSIEVRIHVANSFALAGQTHDVNSAGEGVHVPPAGAVTAQHVGVSGRGHVRAGGAGDTSPHSGAGQSQIVRDPPWIIFGHEVCGHARLQDPAGARLSHTQSPEGNRGAIDIENRIRREHSTAANNYGIRRGWFRDSANGRHDGSIYQVLAGETLTRIATRCGLTFAQILTHIFRENGDPITPATRNTLGANERLLIEGIYWHDVIAGETVSSIATMWAIPEASIRRANPALATAGSQPSPGNRLLIPSS